MGSKTATSTSTQSLPPEVLAAYRGLIQRATPIADRPYQPYTGGFTSDQQTAFRNIGDLAGSANGSFGSAAANLNNSVVPTYQSVGNYMSPYVRDVVNATIANQNEQNAEQQQGVIGNAIAKGAFGGNRVGVAQAELARQQNLANQQTIAGLYNQAYGQALGAAQAQQSAEQGAAGQFTNLGSTALNSNLQQAAAQLGAGTQQQQFNYGLYQNQQAYPFQTTSWLANIVEGLGNNMGGTTTSTQPDGNTFSSLLGTGLSIASLFSDRRVKEGVVPVGRTFDGQTIYRYAYKGDPTPRMGLIAQEVERSHPEAVSTVGGVKAVDYDAATRDAQQRGHFAQGGVIPYGPTNDNLGLIPYMNSNDNFGGYVPGGALPVGRAQFPQATPIAQQSSDPFDGLNKETLQKGANNIKSWFGFGGKATGGVVRRGYDAGGFVSFPYSNYADLNKVFADGTPAYTPNISDLMPTSSPSQSLDGVLAPRLSPAGLKPVDLVQAQPERPSGLVPQQAALPAGMGAVPPAAGPATPSGAVVPQRGGLNQVFADNESQYGLPQGYLATTAKIESNDNPNADNGMARGMFQFTAPTAKQYGLSDPYDPVAAAGAAARLASDNAKFLAAGLGRAPTAGELYLAHQQGAENALNLLTHPGQRAVDVAGTSAITQNGGTPAMTAGQFANIWTSRFDNAGVQPVPGSTAINAPTISGVVPSSGFGLRDPNAGYATNLGDVINSLKAGHGLDLSPDMRMALLSAGLGMMAGTSPNALTNIGAGGLKGIEAYMQKQALNRENAVAQSGIAAQQGELGLTGQQVQQEGQRLFLTAQQTAADIANTTAQANRANVEAAAAHYVQTVTPAGILIRDATNPEAQPRLITWDQVQAGAELPSTAPAAPAAPVSNEAVGAASASGKALPASVPASPAPPTAADHSDPSEGFITTPPAHVPLNGMLMNPLGQEVARDQTVKGLEQARTDYQAGQAMKVQIGLMKDAIAQLPQTGFLSQGAGAQARTDIAKQANTLLQMAGIQPYFDPAAVGSMEDLNKLTTRFGFDLARTLGSREAASIVQEAQGAVPGAENTKQGFARIVSGIEAMAQRQSDYYQAMQNWAQKTGGDITGFDAWFNSMNPPEKYARSALLSTAIVPKSQSDINRAPAGTMFNINGRLLVK